MKVYLDENLSPEIASLFRDRGIDAVSAYEVRRHQVADRAHLALATADDRAVVTRDVVDFVFLSRQIRQYPDGLPGSVVYLQRLPRA